jgi:hypothetical protein
MTGANLTLVRFRKQAEQDEQDVLPLIRGVTRLLVVSGLGFVVCVLCIAWAVVS